MAKQRNGLLKIVAELLIVFVGVYGAFELNRYQQSQREEKIREAYFKSFKSELNKLAYDIRLTQKAIDQGIVEFETSIENGERRRLTPLEFSFDAPMLITKAGFNDDVFTQLNEGLAASLSGGYDNVQLVSQKIKRFNDLCDRQFISNTPISFYDSRGNLKPEFDWYLEELKNLQKYMQNLNKMISEGAIPAVDKLLLDF